MSKPSSRLALAAALLLLAAAPAGAADPDPAVDEILAGKCNFCHSSKRIYTIDTAKVRETVERMRALNPDWITEAQSEHVITVIAKLLDDPNAIAQRKAWDEAVGRGAALFQDTKLGTNGKSCAACHPAKSLVNVADAFPKWDPELKRFVSLEEAIRMMISKNLAGDVGPTDQRLFDLIAYLKSLP